ncbi:hypothetical protein R5R35_014735 [Gryllus longicercus]|uniref:Beta-1,4-N-acetylgalactosaminyltransferase n=1 Tax=Gryllus longicercus TaxID=2509291 RepID=A0AAN9VRA5_9ORTH
MTYTYYKQDSFKIRRWAITKLLIACLFCTFIVACFVALSPITKVVEECECPSGKVSAVVREQKVSDGARTQASASKHKLAVLVPYRDRFEELLEFAPYIHKFLNKQDVNHHIYVLNQVDRYRFNRASLINVGFHESSKDCDYIAMHDVDLLPMNPHLSYQYPASRPFHVAAPKLHPRYHYPTFVGGILLIKREDFKRVNGMSNKYWGWGLEDDEFYVRLKEAGLNVSRPTNISTGSEDTFRHLHDRDRRKRDMTKCFNQRAVTRRRDRQTGLLDVSYTIKSVYEMVIDSAPVTILNIELRCNKTLTPWCECEESQKTDISNKGSFKKPDAKTL